MKDEFSDLSGDPTLNPRHYRFARTSGLAEDYFERRTRIRPFALVVIVLLLLLGFWATSVDLSDEEITARGGSAQHAQGK